jgi:hypothetical protein
MHPIDTLGISSDLRLIQHMIDSAQLVAAYFFQAIVGRVLMSVNIQARNGKM